MEGSNGNGRSIEDIAAAEPEQLVLETPYTVSEEVADAHGLGLDPTSLLKVGSFSVELDGQYRQGDRVTVVVEAEVGDVTFKVVKRKGAKVGRRREHQGDIVALRRG